MNIFMLHGDPSIAAPMHCDKHVVKMCVEATQMLVSAAKRHGATEAQLPRTKTGNVHRGGHANHPCTVWAGDSRANYEWLLEYGRALCREYTFRYGKEHACEAQIEVCAGLVSLLPSGGLTDPAQAMPDEYRSSDPVAAYRDYYWHDKRHNIQCDWSKGRPAPGWWHYRLSQE